LAWIDDIIDAFGFNVCLDVGHLILENTPLLNTHNHHCGRITIFHLHGVKAGRDHQSMNHLSEAVWNLLLDMLKGDQGIASIEVVSFDHLKKIAI